MCVNRFVLPCDTFERQALNNETCGCRWRLTGDTLHLAKVVKLTSDPVPNVRFNAAKTILVEGLVDGSKTVLDPLILSVLEHAHSFCFSKRDYSH